MTFEVLEFSEDGLFKALSNAHVSPAEVRKQGRAVYLHRYLAELGAQSIVVEHEYTDGDYLDDFAAYYVKCFARYERRCKRLHFFQVPLTKESVQLQVRGSSNDEQEVAFRKSYLGFIVARPLPEAIIGRTVLATYPDDGGRRNYPCARQYKANLFGIELPVQTLAFQEQDTVLAACATVSLWSCFQKTSELFVGTQSPTPAIITRAATQSVHFGRPFPSHGLTAVEICGAIRHVGLEPEVFESHETLPLVSLIHGYLKMGLPVILGVHVEGVGGHAITLTGYSLRKERVRNQEIGGNTFCIPMTGLRVDEFFGHDDQIGPFSRLKITPSAKFGHTAYPVCFESDWTDRTTGRALPLYPHVVIVPVYHKIRLTFLDVQEWLTRLTQVLRLVLPATPLHEWDIHLALSNEYKKSIRVAGVGVKGYREELLLTPLPRFLWRAALAVEGKKMVELLFDATGVSRSLPLEAIVWETQAFASAVSKILDAPQLRPLLIERLGEPFWDRLKASIEKQFGSATLF